MTSDSKVLSYSYDYHNRLKQVKLNDQTVFQAGYDGDGRRIKTMDATTRLYHYAFGTWDPVYVKGQASGVISDVVFAGGLRIAKVYPNKVTRRSFVEKAITLEQDLITGLVLVRRHGRS